MQHMVRHVAPILAVLLAAGCAQTQWSGGGLGPSQALRTPGQTMDLEVTDRIARFSRLAGMDGVVAPEITQVVLPTAAVPEAIRPIPVIRVVFDERDFFDPGSDVARPEAAGVLRVIADDMRRDVPDVRLTVLGHTDAEGSDATNAALSQRRALGVMRTLIADGVNPGQLSALAIGRAQPIAPNATLDGRARNRRVEFLISPSEQANLAVVSLRPINPTYLALGSGDAPAVPTSRRVAVYHPGYAGRPGYSGPSDVSETPGEQGGRLLLTSGGPDVVVGGHSDPAANGRPVSAARRDVAVMPEADPGDTGSPMAAVPRITVAPPPNGNGSGPSASADFHPASP